MRKRQAKKRVPEFTTRIHTLWRHARHHSHLQVCLKHLPSEVQQVVPFHIQQLCWVQGSPVKPVRGQEFKKVFIIATSFAEFSKKKCSLLLLPWDLGETDLKMVWGIFLFGIVRVSKQFILLETLGGECNKKEKGLTDVFWEELHGIWSVLSPIRVVAHPLASPIAH